MIKLQQKQQEQFSLADAFDYFREPSVERSGNSMEDSIAASDQLSDLNLERAIRSVGFLCHYLSEMGNQNGEGNSINGIGFISERIADDYAKARANHEYRMADLRKLIQRK